MGRGENSKGIFVLGNGPCPLSGQAGRIKLPSGCGVRCPPKWTGPIRVNRGALASIAHPYTDRGPDPNKLGCSYIWATHAQFAFFFAPGNLIYILTNISIFHSICCW